MVLNWMSLLKLMKMRSYRQLKNYLINNVLWIQYPLGFLKKISRLIASFFKNIFNSFLNFVPILFELAHISPLLKNLISAQVMYHPTVLSNLSVLKKMNDLICRCLV